MTTQAVPDVECSRHHTILAVPDVVAASEFYVNTLGFKHGFFWGQPATIAGVCLGDLQLYLTQGKPNPEGCSVSFVVGDADELFEYHRVNGVDIVEPPGDRPYGLRDYVVRDLCGYHLCFAHYIHSVGEPVLIERVDIPLRIEKRLGGLLRDLAAYKRMSLTNCLEEILLHTCEPLGEGVASPHTRRQLAHIQELKKKHGIDYDCHASYRFQERA
jgi:catechol 2,3-dioxygenase-like lactoylglutathione lyase family enzyme